MTGSQTIDEPVSVRSTGSDDRPRRYVARELDLTVTADEGAREYTITPALIDAIAHQGTHDDIDRYGIAGLAMALTYAVDREQDEITYRLSERVVVSI